MTSAPAKLRQRVRLRFRKEGDVRLISHRDLMRTLERLFRRAELNLGMSEGFHPRPRMSFPAAMAVGIRGVCEVLDLELTDRPEMPVLLETLNAQAPPGLSFTSAELLSAGERKAAVAYMTYELPLPAERQAPAAERIAALLAQDTHWIARAERDAPIDLLAGLDRLELIGGALCMRLAALPEGSPRPLELLEALGLADLLEQGHYLTRTEVTLAGHTNQKVITHET